MLRFARLDGTDVAINPAHIVAAYPAVDPTQTVIVTLAVASFSASSGSLNYVVDQPLDDVLNQIGS